MRESAHEFHCTHAGRSTTIYYRHTADELDLPDELWELVRVKANLLTPSKKPIARESTRNGRSRRVYDKPRTPWERLKEFDDQDRAAGGHGYIPDDKREEIKHRSRQ